MAGVELGGTFGTKVVVDPAKLAELLRGPNGPVVRMLIKHGDTVKAGAQRRVHVWKPASGEPEWSIRRRTKARRPGTLRDSIVKRVVESGGDVMVIVGSEDPIALYHHEGTPAHTIAASKAPQLVFWSARRGVTVRTEAVHHPGTNANRFLVDALDDLRGQL